MSKYITNKEDICKNFKIHATDTGSPFVQVALLTSKITYLTGHLQEHKKDHDARRSLLIMVAKRRTYLSYIKKNYTDKYLPLITALKIRDTHK